MSIDDRSTPFIEDDSNLKNKGNSKSSDNIKEENLTTEQREELKELNEFKEHKKYIKDLIKNAKYVSLPDDPHYVPMPDELLEVNEIDPKQINTVTCIMINVALSDYAVIRKISESGEAIPEKIDFKHVNYDEYIRYQEAQEDIDYANNMIAMIQGKEDYGIKDLAEIRKVQKDIKIYIDKKISVGLEVFFKNAKPLLANKGKYQYNDLLFAIETGFYKYIKSPFLRQISSTKNS